MTTTADGVRRRLAALLGEEPGPDGGVVHVTSAVRTGPDRLAVLRIGSSAPNSSSDGLMLASVRARADVILTTGAVLRAEPTVTPDPPVETATAEALREWRRVRLRRQDLPRVAVLTSGRGLDPGHPMLRWAGGVVVLTASGGEEPLRRRLPASVEVWGLAELSARSALAYLLGLSGVRTVAVEAGPSTAAPLYLPPPVVDELVLSVFEGRGRAQPEVVGELPPPSYLERVLPRRSAPVRVLEPSGEWSFQRLLRGACGP